jgi:anti-sigma regulatory factor (Ser/Thr protein kinase)
MGNIVPASGYLATCGESAAPIPPAHHGHFASSRRAGITLPAQPGSARSARVFAVDLLRAWGLDRLSEDVALVTSELTTNAIVASIALSPVIPPVHIRLVAGERWLVVSVADASPRFPLRMTPAQGIPGGRGLAVVGGVADRWGWHRDAKPGQVKTVWAEWETGDGR